MNKAAAFLRVSSLGQFENGDSPAEQLEGIELLKSKYKADIVNTFTFHESAGKETQPLEKIFDSCIQNDIRYVFLKNIDRASRAGARTYLRLFDKFKEAGIEICDSEEIISHDTKNTMDKYEVEYDFSVYRPSEETEIRKAQEAENDRRRILTRLISSEIRYGRLGYWVGGHHPEGYDVIKINTDHGKRAVLKLNGNSKYIQRMYELKATGMSDSLIVEQINEMGYRSRNGKPLTIKQLNFAISNPVYALVRSMRRQRGKDERGRPIFKREEPVRLHGEQLISDELFNQANKGKIEIMQDENGKVQILRGKVPTWQLFKSRQSEEYPFKPFVLCPRCKNPFMASAPIGKMGKKYPQYHCNRKHKWFSVNKDKFNQTIKDFVSKVKLDDDTILRLKESYARQYEQSRSNSLKNVMSVQEQVDQKQKEQQKIIDQIAELSSLVVIKKLEQKVDALESEIVRLQNARKKQETKKTDSQNEISRFWYFLEHLEELVINADNPIRSATFFSLMFEEKPTYEDLIAPNARTLKLAWCFKLNQIESPSVDEVFDFSNPNILAYINKVSNTVQSHHVYA